MKSALVLMTLTLATQVLAVETGGKVLYGEDNRYDVFEYKDAAIVELSKSTVGLVKSYTLHESGNKFTVDETNFQSSANVCSDERFSKQPVAAFCSGFLIAPNKIVTAGHCIESDSDCSETSFLFDYKMRNPYLANTRFTKDQVYSCKKVLGQIKINGGLDFAVIELDRDVKDRKPLKLSDNKNLKKSDELFVIGHPVGLPTKITDNAFVRDIKTDRGFFVANLDTYGGNSGSAVFNAKTLEVEGILVRGEKDFEYDFTQECNLSYEVNNYEGRGEDVSLISRINENGYNSQTSTPSSVSGEINYIWLDADQTCNEFRGSSYIR